MTSQNQNQNQQSELQPAQASTAACGEDSVQWQGPFKTRAQIREQLQHGQGSRSVWITRDGRVSYCGHVDPSITEVGEWIPAGRIEDYPADQEPQA